MNLTQQLENKKKELKKVNRELRQIYSGFEDLKSKLKIKKKVIQAEIAILEQAIAEIKKKDEVINFYAETLKETNEKHKVEMQKQRQEEIGFLKSFEKDKMNYYRFKNAYMNREIEERIKKLEQLNQPKTEQ